VALTAGGVVAAFSGCGIEHDFTVPVYSKTYSKVLSPLAQFQSAGFGLYKLTLFPPPSGRATCMTQRILKVVSLLL
jgi:hypothetical protein